MCKQGKITLLGGSTEIERDTLSRSTAGHMQESSPGTQQRRVWLLRDIVWVVLYFDRLLRDTIGLTVSACTLN